MRHYEPITYSSPEELLLKLAERQGVDFHRFAKTYNELLKTGRMSIEDLEAVKETEVYRVANLLWTRMTKGRKIMRKEEWIKLVFDTINSRYIQHYIDGTPTGDASPL